MVKSRLDIAYEFDFILFGLITLAKEYKLAWLLNNHLGIHLIKQKDIQYDLIGSNPLIVSNYLYETENTQFRLVKNKSDSKNAGRMIHLLPELHKFDFFIMKKGTLDGKEDSGFLFRLRQIEEIQYATQFDIQKLKSRENLIF